jgi:hypothetical protein
MPAAAAALAIWAGLGGTALLLADQRPAAAQSAEAVGRIAQAITVRIEGATQGSGVLVRREGNRYTVLTAWHVVADQKPGEELDIYAPDGNRYPVEQGSIKRLGEVDLAVLTFSSDRAYTIAITGEPRGLPLGSSLYVSGFPLGTSSVPLRLMRLLRGDLVGNGVVDASRSQYLLYSNPTLPGMSGGAVLNLRAELIGIHINAERADQISESTGKPVATGVNQGLAIGAYRKWLETDSGAIAGSGARLSPSPDPNAESAPSTIQAPWPTQQELSTAINDFRKCPPAGSSCNINLALIAWQINKDGVLILKTKSKTRPYVSFLEGGPHDGPRVLIDLPGRSYFGWQIAGSGRIRYVRMGRPSLDKSRFVVEFSVGTNIEQADIVEVKTGIWKMDFGPAGAPLRVLGQGII